jgi:hypothetical protein
MNPVPASPFAGEAPANAPLCPTLLLEAIHFASRVLVIVAAVGVGLLSVVARAEPLVAVLRSGVAVLSLGAVAWLLNWLVARGVLAAAQAEWKAKAQAAQAKTEARATSTVELEA